VTKRKTKRKKAIAKSKPKPKPDIFVKIAHEWSTYAYAKAHIRVKSGGYQYLEWKDGARPRSLYLGKKR
jgi:hypothetical protein